MRTLIESRWFALLSFIAVTASGICLYVWPQGWMWALLLPTVLWGMRSAVKRTLYLHPMLVGCLIIFILTAAVGAWAAYDETAAWNKFCIVIAAVLFCLVIVGQPAENLKFLIGFWFFIAVGIAVYFLLTIDFNEYTIKFAPIHQLGLAWMRLRPVSLPFMTIHPNDAGGLPIILGAYALMWLGVLRGNRFAGSFPKFVVLAGIGIILFTFLLSSSRGAYLSVAGAVSIWIMWRLVLSVRLPNREALLRLFPGLVTLGVLLLGMLVFVLPSRFLGASFSVGGNVLVSRAEVLRSGMSIVQDFPFTGGGLESFPGLYSQYVLSIPFYSIIHSHNMFLDVAIEQGILGGISYALVYLLVIWQLLKAWKHNQASDMQWLYFAACLSLLTAIFHGFVDDYIYGGKGTILAFIPAAMSLWITRIAYERQLLPETAPKPVTGRTWMSISKAWVWIIPVVLLFALTWNRMTAQWYANLGAVKMAKLDLAHYPANQWTEEIDVSAWELAKLDFQRALAYEADNKTANHRLGLIRLIARDFESASEYLHKAYEKDPVNRGIVKSLGYSYLWLGETETAQPFLSRVPEAKYELDVYVWWWNTHERQDLAERAFKMSASLDTQP